MDWLGFFAQHRIQYREHGRNVSKGNVVIACPLCGDDPGQHLSVSLSGRGWYCWRNPQHQGATAAPLIAALIHVPIDNARRIAGEELKVVPADFMGSITALLGGPVAAEPEELDIPGLRPFDRPSPARTPYVRYLMQRGFRDEPEALAALYGVTYAIDGPQAGRIVFSISSGGKLIAVAGRAVGRREPRYLTAGPIKDYLLWEEQLEGHTLVIDEGPFDALKVNYLGYCRDIAATCLFGSQASDLQVSRLVALMRRFRRTVILLDANNEAAAYQLASRLRPLTAEVAFVRDATKDAGDLATEAELLATLG